MQALVSWAYEFKAVDLREDGGVSWKYGTDITGRGTLKADDH
jgi:hypothetical protein